MRTSKSKTMYLCDCWIEAYEFVVRFNSEEMIKVEFIGDVLDVASNYHAKTNMLIWRFLKRNPCYYLTEAGEPVALAQKWLKIPSKNLEIAGNNMYILRNGILGEGDREQICSDETYMTEVLGAAKGRPIVVISTDWKKFILRQAPDAQIDLETPEGRTCYIIELWDTGAATKKAEAVDQMMGLGASKTEARQAWVDARRTKRPDMGNRGRKASPKN